MFKAISLIGGLILMFVIGGLVIVGWKLLMELFGFIVENIKVILIIIAIIIVIYLLGTFWSLQLKK